ncbi:L-histidine N(alpha)-methyltransferase [Nitrosopumilus cobalaminigenes]|uniref:L-histidine N(Alpha)-methyltransferase n=1 Tax=Nitrosopumilus cobalaminigenes TaxID=1470066 RepID=A0A7D5LZC5_9ARCH|nr:L-histidine N(alpha)-methyltransferase [Nitrosopumilus cobalaminigenes]QLH03094.1 L-histidine N(alpha)-methyltransferase [Nitrosopumilus cobalaminigenes]
MTDIIQKNLDYKKYVVDSNLQYFKPHATQIEKTFAEEISSSLNRNSKFISPKFFYDKNGSELFEKICSTSEYYPTRTEISILKQLKNELPPFLDDDFRLVELGSGSSVKTRLLLDILTSQKNIEYLPIDISEILAESSEQLLRDYDNLTITGIIDTYEGGLEFLKTYDKKKNLIIFLGSSYGNFSPIDGYKFLEKVYSAMKPGDLFLIGLDLVKEKEILESAYDDSQKVTAKFNLNVLSRINDELDADFDLNNFLHHAIYNEKDQRIEMYLKSIHDQSVIISKSNLELKLKKDELIHTEYSHKYRLSEIHDLLDDAGFELKHTWLDEKKHFSLSLVTKI